MYTGNYINSAYLNFSSRVLTTCYGQLTGKKLHCSIKVVQDRCGCWHLKVWWQTYKIYLGLV